MRGLLTILPKKSGRSHGVVTVRHQGGRHKRFLRTIDFRRDKKEVWGRVESIEYDPNRTVKVALIVYEDGERRYILSPEGLKVGAKIISSEVAPLEPGNALPLSKIPAGTPVHAIEITPGKGAQMVKSAGLSAIVQGKEESYMLVRLPSTEIRRFPLNAMATIGQLSNPGHRSERIGKAGRKRRMGIRPSVRGVAMHPNAHPHGGGEGRSSVGMKHPKTPYGKPAVGKTRLKRKYSNYLIAQKRKPGKHA